MISDSFQPLAIDLNIVSWSQMATLILCESLCVPNHCIPLGWSKDGNRRKSCVSLIHVWRGLWWGKKDSVTSVPQSPFPQSMKWVLWAKWGVGRLGQEHTSPLLWPWGNSWGFVIFSAAPLYKVVIPLKGDNHGQGVPGSLAPLQLHWCTKLVWKEAWRLCAESQVPQDARGFWVGSIICSICRNKPWSSW